MNKAMIIFALSILFQTALYADEQRAQDNTNLEKVDPEIITPAVGSQYNLQGMQTRDGRYKSSYSTKSVEKKKQAPDSSLQPAGLNNGDAAVPVIIVIDGQD